MDQNHSDKPAGAAAAQNADGGAPTSGARAGASQCQRHLKTGLMLPKPTLTVRSSLS